MTYENTILEFSWGTSRGWLFVKWFKCKDIPMKRTEDTANLIVTISFFSKVLELLVSTCISATLVSGKKVVRLTLYKSILRETRKGHYTK